MGVLDNLPPRVIKQAKIYGSEQNLAFIEYARTVLLQVGFVLADVSMKSEACYYSYNNNENLLRVASHRMGRQERVGIARQVIARITFNHDVKSIEDAHGRIWLGVGKYMTYAFLDRDRVKQILEVT